MREDRDLTPESAATKLGGALLEAGKTKEALKILTRAVADNPSSELAIDLLSQALENANGDAMPPAIDALRQAVFANPDNESIVQLLARTIVRTGKIDDAVKVLKTAVANARNRNKFSASKLQVAVGDIFAESNRTDEAILAYEEALKIRGIEKNKAVAPGDKDFASRVIRKMVETLKKAGRIDEANLLLRNSRSILGGDIAIFKGFVKLFREVGDDPEALKVV